MYAAAGGASLANRQARRKQKQHHTSENIHQQFHKRFQKLQHQHAPACAEGYNYNMRTSSSGLLSPSHLPSYADLHGRAATTIEYNLHEQLLEGKSSTVWSDRDKKGGNSPYSEIAPPLIAHHGKLKISEAQKKWAKRNKMHNPSFGESSIEEVRSGLHRQYDAAANMLLYVGLCAVALGLVIAFVGTGEKGFKTVQLRLIGPTMIGCGAFCCFLRIVFCFCPTRRMRKRFKHRHKNMTSLSDAAKLNRHGFTANDKAYLDFYTQLPLQRQITNNFLLLEQTSSSILKDAKKRVSIAPEKDGKRTALIDQNVKDFIIDEAASDTLSTLKELSPSHEDLIDFQQSSNSFENLPSLDSSLEYLNKQLNGDDNDDVIDNKETSQKFTSEEQWLRLKSTLTFRDSTDQFADSRLMISCDEFDLQDDLKCTQDKKDEKCKLHDKRDKNDTEMLEARLIDQELVLSAGTLQKNN